MAYGEYPKTEITQKNFKDAYILQSLYASPKSEMTTVFDYLYQSQITANSDGDIAYVLKNIAITEMNHCGILSRLILLSGGNPMIGARGSFWSGGYVNYSQNIKKMLYEDILSEQCAIENYRRAIKNISDKSVACLLERILADEQVHAATLSALYDYLNS